MIVLVRAGYGSTRIQLKPSAPSPREDPFYFWVLKRAGDVVDTDTDLPKHAQQPVIDGSKDAGHDGEIGSGQKKRGEQR